MKTAILALLATAGVAISSAAPAQMPCMPLETMVSALSNDFGEIATGVGASSSGHLTVLFVNPETESWTIATVDGQGTACLRDAGHGFQPPTESLMPSLLHGTRI